MSLVKKYNHWLNRIITSPDDDEGLIFIKKLWFSLIIISIAIIIPNAIYCRVVGLYYWYYASLIFVLAHVLLLVVFLLRKSWIRSLIIAMQVFYMLFSFYYVVAGGGILKSGGMVLIGLAGGPIASLVFHGRRLALLFIVTYSVLVIAEFFVSDQVQPQYVITEEINKVFFIAHLLVVSIMMFLIVQYYIAKNKEVSEKENALLNKVLPKTVVREFVETGSSTPR